ncbi:MAG TPA: tRNA (adenosine(37)-N6)-threonylcarbamoyltransferase complex ATPase subunit type 1 TsaE [Pseudolysinimonas sp.]|nr:tRNA (adenosine(37)-N6)-threonylcarbamoyltransferase complex ATPase subunit type 1 TsaE [Pseudolysinimonas sp.]
MIQLTILDTAQMEALGARLAPLLRAGDLVLLNGELGAGKTTLARGLGAALGARGAVTSPTFVLAREHPTASGVPLVHVDAYRLSTGRELDDLDLDYEHGIVVVEWGAGKLDGVSDSWLSIDIQRRIGGTGLGTLTGDDLTDDDLSGDDPRDVTIAGHGPRGVELEAALAARD